MLETKQLYSPVIAYGPEFTSSRLKYVAVAPFWSICDILYVPLSESSSPSFLQVTELAGEPEEMQLRVKSGPKLDVDSRDLMVGGAKSNLLRNQ